jgi:aspartyl-tRNA(Asn)/glutamyl-tRNA(Gln) amidotransferase subunit A
VRILLLFEALGGCVAHVDRNALTLVGAARAVASGELSPVELTESCLARIKEVDAEIRAFVALDADGALARARALTEELSTSGPRSPLHGIPFGIKDLIDVAGLPTTAGSRILAGNVADADAPVVAALRAAGAIILGKTNTQEFAYGVVTAPTRNPWDVSRIPGGSSGGSAAAVAAGMCPGALGTDTAGSIRIPAALCGVAGLKPSNGRLSLDRIVPLAPSLDACGPIARTAEDCALVWRALSGDAPADAFDFSQMRIAVPGAIEEVMAFSGARAGEMGIDPEVAGITRSAAEALEDAGAVRTEVDLPPFSRWDFPRSVQLMIEALVVHEDAGWYPAHSDEYTAETLAAHRFAEKLGAATLLRSYRKLEVLKAAWLRVIDDVDVLMLPTTPVAAPSIEASRATDDGHRPPVTRTLTRICGPVNVCGLAAASVPAGTTSTGLPVGIQFIARDESAVLGAALAFEALAAGGPLSS